MRLEIGSGFCGFADANDNGGNDDDGDDEDVCYWLGKYDVGICIFEDGELVSELLSLIILSKEVSFELVKYCSSAESLSIYPTYEVCLVFLLSSICVVIMFGNEVVNHYYPGE